MLWFVMVRSKLYGDGKVVISSGKVINCFVNIVKHTSPMMIVKVVKILECFLSVLCHFV